MVARTESQATDVPGIVIVVGPAGPRAHVEGGVDVWKVVLNYRLTDGDIDRILDGYHWMTRQQVDAALTYYQLHPAEIDQWIAEEEAITPESIRETIALAQARAARRKSK